MTGKKHQCFPRNPHLTCRYYLFNNGYLKVSPLILPVTSIPFSDNMNKKVLEFRGVEKAVFQQRENRFTVRLADGRRAHLHDPGRLKELLVPGAEMIIVENCGKKRKTCHDVLAVKHGKYWVFLNSGYHSEVAEAVIPSVFGQGIAAREVKIGGSRIDFLLEDDRPLEVKGCTLLRDRIAFFPDAPTTRGARHALEIARHKGSLLFLVFHPTARELKFNCGTDPDFCTAVRTAAEAGAEIRAVKFKTIVRDRTLTVYFVGEVPVTWTDCFIYSLFLSCSKRRLLLKALETSVVFRALFGN